MLLLDPHAYGGRHRPHRVAGAAPLHAGRLLRHLAGSAVPGSGHDACPAPLPLAFGWRFSRRLPLAGHGREWIQPPAAVVHPFDDGTAAVLERSTRAMEGWIGSDATAWQALMNPFVARW